MEPHKRNFNPLKFTTNSLKFAYQMRNVKQTFVFPSQHKYKNSLHFSPPNANTKFPPQYSIYLNYFLCCIPRQQPFH